MFAVRVADNARHMEEDEGCAQSEFATWTEAVAAARGIVDRCLAEHYRPGMAAEALFSLYTSFGDDPYVVPEPPGSRFSAWDYARERCAALCAAPPESARPDSSSAR